jgi:integrase
MLVRDSIAAFLLARAANRKPATIAHYRGRLTAFVEQIGDRDAAELTELECRRYLDASSRFADGRPKAPDTIRANFIAFDQWQKWAVKSGHLEKLLVTDYEKPGSRGRDRIPTAAEIATILRYAPADFALIYRALRACGARPGELCKAQITNVNWQIGLIELADHKTARKTGKPRRIALGRELKKLVLEAIGSRTAGPIFLSSRGKPWTVPALGQIFRRIRTKTGLPKDLVLYLARHEFASRLVDRDVDINAVAESLGHSGLQTVRRYVKVKPEKLIEWQDKLGDDEDESAERKTA